MRVSGEHHLVALLGLRPIFLATGASSGIGATGQVFVGAHALSIPLSDFSHGRAYRGAFIDVTTRWHQTQFGDDYHQLCVARVRSPSGAGKSVATPAIDQSPFEGYPSFTARYFSDPITQIEVRERTICNFVDGQVVEEITYDSHIRLVSKTAEVVLTTEHGTILGEIELSASAANARSGATLASTRARLVLKD